MDTAHRCQACGIELWGTDLGGLCPACLLRPGPGLWGSSSLNRWLDLVFYQLLLPTPAEPRDGC